MSRSAAVLATSLALASGLWVGRAAHADVVSPPQSCAPWEQREVISAHGVSRCVPRSCSRDAQCGGGHCQVFHQCEVAESYCDREGEGPAAGPCPESRQRTRVRRGARCSPGSICAQGSCAAHRECVGPL